MTNAAQAEQCEAHLARFFETRRDNLCGRDIACALHRGKEELHDVITLEGAREELEQLLSAIYAADLLMNRSYPKAGVLLRDVAFDVMQTILDVDRFITEGNAQSRKQESAE